MEDANVNLDITKTKKIQLIDKNKHEFGNVTNDGSGEPSVNLLTGNYLGNWSYFDSEKDSLINLPTIKTKLKFSKLYFEEFSDKICYNYADKCAELYYKQKNVHSHKK